MAIPLSKPSDKDGSSFFIEGGLVAGRSKRSTAGNRMRALLDQQHSMNTNDEDDEIFREEENDGEFGLTKDAEMEQDVFDSDFESSDEGEGNAEEEEDAGEKELQEAEDKQRKAARKQASRMAPSVRARPKPKAKAISRAPAVGEDPAESSTKAGRRIKFASDVGDGSIHPRASKSRRTSSRSSTVQAALDTQERIEEAEARRLQHHNVKNPPSQQKKQILTQADLIELALNREEENRKSLKEWLEGEEDRKQKELSREKRAMPSSWLRWRSVGTIRAPAAPLVRIDEPEGKTENTVTSEPALPGPVDTVTGMVKDDETEAPSEDTLAVKGPKPVEANVDKVAEPSQALEEQSVDIDDTDIQTPPPEDKPEEKPSGPPPSTVLASTVDEASASTAPVTSSQPANASPAIPAEGAPVAAPTLDLTLDPVVQARRDAQAAAEAASTTKAAKDVTSADYEGRTFVSLHYASRPPPWTEQWRSLFGSHADWENPQVVPTRNRPSRPRASLCAITGKMARYKDAKTGIPFADVKAAKVLRSLVDNGWEWVEVEVDPTQQASTSAPKGKKGKAKQGDGATVEDLTQKEKKASKKKKALLPGQTNADEPFKTGFWVSPRPTEVVVTALAVPAVQPVEATAGATQKRGPGRPKKSISQVPAEAQRMAPSPSPASKMKAEAPTPGPEAGSPSLKKSRTSSAAPPTYLGARSTASLLRTEEERDREWESVPEHLRMLGVAPGDEKALLAKVLAIPEGTTRSGRARGAAPASSVTPKRGGGGKARSASSSAPRAAGVATPGSVLAPSPVVPVSAVEQPEKTSAAPPTPIQTAASPTRPKFRHFQA